MRYRAHRLSGAPRYECPRDADVPGLFSGYARSCFQVMGGPLDGNGFGAAASACCHALRLTAADERSLHAAPKSE